MDVVVRPNAAAAARAIADRFPALVRRAFAARGRCAVAFSGGTTAAVLFKALVDTEVMWGAIDVYQVDERVAPDGDPARNATGLVRDFAEQVGLPDSRLHLMDVTAADLPGAARRYGAALPMLDVVHLGLGEDGHTASWPPGDPVVDVTEPVGLSQPYQGHVRMTLTPAAVNAAGQRVVLVTGVAKAAAVAALRAGDRSLPASRVTPTATVLYVDAAAAGE